MATFVSLEVGGEPIYYRIGHVWSVPPPLLYSLCMLYYMYV